MKYAAASTPFAASWPWNWPSSKLHRVAWEFAVKWGVALADNQPTPEPHSFPRKVGATGVRVTSHMSAVKYLEECREKNTAPDAQKLLYRLMPCARDFPYNSLLALQCLGT